MWTIENIFAVSNVPWILRLHYSMFSPFFYNRGKRNPSKDLFSSPDFRLVASYQFL